jgi:hypothetical protein
LIETKNPQFVFLNQEIANKIKQKHQVSNRKFILIVEPNQMLELDHKALQIVDALNSNQSNRSGVSDFDLGAKT